MSLQHLLRALRPTAKQPSTEQTVSSLTADSTAASLTDAQPAHCQTRRHKGSLRPRGK